MATLKIVTHFFLSRNYQEKAVIWYTDTNISYLQTLLFT
jgi:hypothetical protein